MQTKGHGGNIMAKVTFTYEEGKQDGYPFDSTFVSSRTDIEDLGDLMLFLVDALKASGYSYVESLAWEDTKGNVTFGDRL